MNDSNNFSQIKTFDSSSGSFSEDRKLCRICLEGKAENNPLISSCSCKGTIKYTHENCLKNWILTLNQDQLNYKCEICNYPLRMKIKYRTVISCKNLKKEICTILLSPYFTFLNSCLILIIADYFYRFAFDFSKFIILKIMFFSCFMALIYIEWFLFRLFFDAIKSGCFDSKVVSWIIFCPDESASNNMTIAEGGQEYDKKLQIDLLKTLK